MFDKIKEFFRFRWRKNINEKLDQILINCVALNSFCFLDLEESKIYSTALEDLVSLEEFNGYDVDIHILDNKTIIHSGKCIGFGMIVNNIYKNELKNEITTRYYLMLEVHYEDEPKMIMIEKNMIIKKN